MLKHGGDRIGFQETYGLDPLDFSVNVNPFGMSPKAKEAATLALSRGAEYPDFSYRKLRKAIGSYLGVPGEYVIPGNGAADLIWRIAAINRTKSALLTAPTFSEYESALTAFDIDTGRYLLIRENGFSLTEDILSGITSGLGVLFLCNPNNPTGKTIEPELMLKILKRCHECGVLFCVDECFNGFLDHPDKHTLRNQLDHYHNLVIIGAFTKLYALAGLRIGYALCADRSFQERLFITGQSWPVSVVAEEAAIAAMQDTDYLEQSLPLLHMERRRIWNALETNALEVIGGEANYLFFHTDIPAFGIRLAEKGFLIRDCSTYTGLKEGDYRITVRMPEDNDRLLEAIKEIIGN